MRKIIIMFLGLLMLMDMGCQSIGEKATELNKGTSGTMIHPWVNCAPGSFVHYKSLGRDGVITQEKQVVVEVNSTQIVIEAFTLVDEKWRSKGKTIIPLQKLDRPTMGMMGMKEDVLTISGRPLKCKTISYKNTAGMIIHLWMSNEVPGGVVRHTNDDRVVLELIDFARK